MKTIRFAYLLFGLVILLAACGGNTTSDTTQPPTDDTAISDRPTSGIEIVLRPVGNEMRYEQTSVTVEAGQVVTLILENTATSPAMAHNIVVLSTNENSIANQIGMAAVTAGPDREYIPDNDSILAYTAVAQPGETVRVTFAAPTEPGSYRYICTFPGHFALMQGTMIVR